LLSAFIFTDINIARPATPNNYILIPAVIYIHQSVYINYVLSNSMSP